MRYLEYSDSVTECTVVIARDKGKDGIVSLFNGCGVPVGEDEEFCGWMVVVVAQKCEGTYCH